MVGTHARKETKKRGNFSHLPSVSSLVKLHNDELDDLTMADSCRRLELFLRYERVRRLDVLLGVMLPSSASWLSARLSNVYDGDS